MSPSFLASEFAGLGGGPSGDKSSAQCGTPRLTAILDGAGPNRVMHQDQEVCEVKPTTYAGHGAEIEEDFIRLRRHHCEFEHDVAAALIGSRPRSRRLKALRPASAVPAVFARWR